VFYFEKEPDFERLLAAIEKWGPDCLRVISTTRTNRFQKQIIEFAQRHKLPDAYEGREWTESGGLVSYGAAPLSIILRSADMVDRILRGARPADIPVELPSRYEAAINMKTARALGLKVPPSVLLRADRVIE
jgi:putative tryptophan/tyrosine transport system substrate-binding protein